MESEGAENDPPAQGAAPSPSSRLSRRLGTGDAVVIGLGAMIGAGVFVAIGPAAAAAGSGLLLGLAIAAFVGFCNATSSAQLAAIHPESGGTYVYGRRQLGDFWGYLAGWGFVVGKLASCAAIALTFGHYLDPAFARPLAIVAVVALTAVNLAGVQKTVAVTRVIVLVVLVALGVVVVATLSSGEADLDRLTPLVDKNGLYGILQASGLLFFAFAGYARIATLGEEVRDPARTIPRAIPLALGIVLLVYLVVAVSALSVVGPAVLAESDAPLTDAVRAGQFSAALPVVRLGAAIATLGVLLSLIAGLSRTIFAMSADRHLPGFLDAVHPRYKIPHRAEIAVAIVVITAVLVADLRGAIGFSSFGVLIYYGIANASACTLQPHQRRWPLVLPIAGLIGCAVLTVTLPVDSVVIGFGVVGAGALIYAVRAFLHSWRAAPPHN